MTDPLERTSQSEKDLSNTHRSFNKLKQSQKNLPVVDEFKHTGESIRKDKKGKKT